MRIFVPRVYQALKDQVAHAITAVKEKGIRSAQGNIHGSIINTQVGQVITDLYNHAAHIAIRKYRPNKKGFGDAQEFIRQVLDYFKKYLLEKVVLPISRTTIEHIERALQEALREGWGVDRAVKELENTDILKSRARMIVRTETVKAANFTQLAAADMEDYEMEKQWIAIEDGRTRRSHSHAGVDGEQINLDEAFSNGLMFPGDPSGSAADVVNCRCTLGYFAKRDLQGNLIRKTTEPLDLLTRININRVA